MGLVYRLYLSIAVAAATLWACAVNAQDKAKEGLPPPPEDRPKKAIILDEASYNLGEAMCRTMPAFQNENRAYCATYPSKDQRRDNLMEIRTIFATMPACAGIYMVVFDDENKVNSPEMMKAKFAESSWWLWPGHLAEVRPGQVYWAIRGGEADSSFDGISTPREVVAKVCAIVQAKGGAVSAN